MTSAIGRARKKFFAQDPDVQQYAAKDTVNEGYVAAADQSEVGRTDLLKHDVPLGLSESDSAILGAVKRHANVLDKSFNLCGVKFGWTFIIAIVPVVGDALNLALGYFLVVRQARKSKNILFPHLSLPRSSHHLPAHRISESPSWGVPSLSPHFSSPCMMLNLAISTSSASSPISSSPPTTPTCATRNSSRNSSSCAASARPRTPCRPPRTKRSVLAAEE